MIARELAQRCRLSSPTLFEMLGTGPIAFRRPCALRRSALLLALVCSLVFASSASSHVGWGHSYWNATLTSGQTASGTGYDWCFTDGVAAYWNGNALQKDHVALGNLIWIDTSGGWRATKETYETNMVYYVSPQDWNKKLTAKNTSSISYSAVTDAQRDQAQNCV